MPAGKRQSIMMMRRGSMARKSLMGGQIGKGVCFKPVLLTHMLLVDLGACLAPDASPC